MSNAVHHHDEIIIPRPVLWMAGSLVLAVVALVAAVRAGAIAPAPSASALRTERHVAPANSRLLRFEDAPAGRIRVTDATTGATVATLTQADGGFVRGVLRAMARERRAHMAGPESPFRLIQWQDGELSLTDPATGRTIELGGFGPTNVAAFARLLGPGGAA